MSRRAYVTGTRASYGLRGVRCPSCRCRFSILAQSLPVDGRCPDCAQRVRADESALPAALADHALAFEVRCELRAGRDLSEILARLCPRFGFGRANDIRELVAHYREPEECCAGCDECGSHCVPGCASGEGEECSS